MVSLFGGLTWVIVGPEVTEPPPVVEHYAVRDQVTHDKYGLGVVIGVEGESAVLVDFGTHKARIAIPCAKLFKL